MNRLKILEQMVTDLYQFPHPSKNTNADWLFTNHVLVVADTATLLAKKYKANEQLSRAAALLHDIADVEMERNNPNHEQRSLEIGRKLLEESNFSEDEITIIIDDAVKFHSCYENGSPKSEIGKILATADALAHFQTGFYPFITNILAPTMTKNELAHWVADKIERDLTKKIFFTDERLEVMPLYKELKDHYNV